MGAALIDARVAPVTPSGEFPTHPDAAGTAAGLHTSVAELEPIGKLAREGEEPLASDVDRLLVIAERGWTHGRVGTRFEGRSGGGGVYDKTCRPVGEVAEASVLADGGQQLHALVLAHVLSGRAAYGEEARAVLLDFARSSGFDTVDGEKRLDGSNQCAFDLGLLVPLLIDSALLLEAYPGWGVADRERLRSWLADEVYPITSAIALTRKNNWGTAAAFASWAIGHYLEGSGMVLEEIRPSARRLTPERAKEVHLDAQLDMLGSDWKGDSRCERFGIQSHGGFPDELRRGSTGCEGEYLLETDSSYSYQITTVSHLIYHAEALRRHGGNELYEYRTAAGEPALLKAVTFVVANPRGKSHDWKSTDLGVLRVANEYYEDARLCAQIAKGFRFVEGRYLPYARLVHPDGGCR